MAQEYLINFFRLLPESETVEVLRRRLEDDENCSDWESLLKVPDGERYVRYAVLSKYPFSGNRSAYKVHPIRFAALPRRVRVKLLDDGLSERFRQRGFDVVRKPFDVDVFDDESEVQCTVPGIRLRRGMRFHLDSAFLGQHRHYGYFVTVKVQRSFSVNLEVPALQNAAQNQRVYTAVAGIETAVTFVSVAQDQAVVISPTGERLAVDISEIRVPTTAPIVRRYLVETHGDHARYGELLNEEQQAALRRTARGQKRRDAGRAQGDFVATWLIKNSEYGRIRFKWPYSESLISLVTTQHTVKAAEAF